MNNEVRRLSSQVYQGEGDTGMYTQTQVIVLELLPFPSAALSVVGSCSILMFLFSRTSRHEKLLETSMFHRLMFMISIFDLVASLALIVLGPWVVPSPQADSFSHFNRGTFTTCAVAGFFNNVSFGAWWYTGFLSLYFLLLVRYEWKDRVIARYIEPWAHFISLAHPLATGIYAVVDDLYNPLRILPGFCWFSDYPPYCSRPDSTVPCQRGDNYNRLSSGVALNSLYIIFLLIAISMVLIILKVRHTELQLRKYTIFTPTPSQPTITSTNNQNEASNPPPATTTALTTRTTTAPSSNPHRHERSRLRRTRETSVQGLLYIAGYFISVLPFVILKFLEETTDDPDRRSNVLFPFAVLAQALSPIQVRKMCGTIALTVTFLSSHVLFLLIRLGSLQCVHLFAQTLLSLDGRWRMFCLFETCSFGESLD